MSNYTIPLSKTLHKLQIVASGVLILAACVLLTVFFRRAISSPPVLQALILILLWVGMPILWAIGSLLLIKKVDKVTYTLTNDSLRIQKKELFGTTSEKFYRYDMILAINSSTSFFGKHEPTFGTLKITLDKLEPIIIHGVVAPKEQAKLIKERVSSSLVQTIIR